MTLAQADTEAQKMISDMPITEFSQMLTRQVAGQANWVYVGELPPRTKPFKEAAVGAGEVGPPEA